jgi:hypothetical protein
LDDSRVFAITTLSSLVGDVLSTGLVKIVSELESPVIIAFFEELIFFGISVRFTNVNSILLNNYTV